MAFEVFCCSESGQSITLGEPIDQLQHTMNNILERQTKTMDEILNKQSEMVDAILNKQSEMMERQIKSIGRDFTDMFV